METFALIPVTIASILGAFTGGGSTVEEAVINTHISPEIAGLWEIDLSQAQTIHPVPAIANRAGNSEVDSSDSRKLTANYELDLAKATTPAAINVDPVTIHTTRTIQLTKQKATNVCYERYNFGADNKVVTSSGAEWTVGEYIYQHADEGLPVLAINTLYDNNEVDCSGQRIDQTGEAMLAYVDYQADTNKMRWCADEAGRQCFITLHRLLP